MKRDLKQVNYSYEHGDENLPSIKELVSEIPDPKKDIILDYLKTNCIMASPGIREDEITQGKMIGAGNIFSDGTYYWNDVFTNYVEKYNIPVPKTFRDYILHNYLPRKKRHALLGTVNRVEIDNTQSAGLYFHVTIYRNGKFEYWNNTDHKTTIEARIGHDDARYIINPIMRELFCYDSDNHGKETIGGYHWRISFYKYNKLIDVVEGWSNEDNWRYGKIQRILAFIERYIPYDLGSKYMSVAKV